MFCRILKRLKKISLTTAEKKTVDDRLNKLVEQFKKTDLVKRGKLSVNAETWIKHPNELWNIMFPGIFKFLKKKQMMNGKKKEDRYAFLYSATLKGFSLHCLFADKTKHNAAKEGSAAVTTHGSEFREYNDKHHKNYPADTISELAGKWNKHYQSKKNFKNGIQLEETTECKNGLSTMHGYKGKIEFDKCATDFQIGLDELEELVENHVFIGADLGIVNHISAVAFDGRVERRDSG